MELRDTHGQCGAALIASAGAERSIRTASRGVGRASSVSAQADSSNSNEEPPLPLEDSPEHPRDSTPGPPTPGPPILNPPIGENPIFRRGRRIDLIGFELCSADLDLHESAPGLVATGDGDDPIRPEEIFRSA